MQPETLYVHGPEGAVAHQVVGNGPFDLVFSPNWASNLDVMWEIPQCAHYLRRLASFSRLILLDKRGSGVSDPVPSTTLSMIPSLEEMIEDYRLVMDAVESSRAALVGDAEGGRMAMVFAATYPDRTSALAIINATARFTRADDYPIGYPPKVLDRVLSDLGSTWGTGALLEATAPSVAGDPGFRRMWARYQRLTMPPRTLIASYRSAIESDLRPVLPLIRVPTLVVHRAENNHVRPAHGRYLAEHIPGARYVEVPGGDYLPFFAGNVDVILDPVQEFLTGSRATPEADRVLATILFTDIVGSTERASAVGDKVWRELLQRHHAVIRESLQRFRGNEVDTAGDGFLATFDGPARGIRCAQAIVEAVRGIGVDIRAGLHAGEVEVMDRGIGGIAVHIGARVSSLAAAGEILVSSTVKDLVAGSGIEFDDRGEHALKGVPGEWRLFAVRS